MKLFIMSIGLFSLLLFSGCGYKEGVTTGEKKSFLYFSGNTSDVLVSVDNAEQFSVKSGVENQYKIESGKHTVRVYRDGRVIVERAIYVGDGIATEIGVK